MLLLSFLILPLIASAGAHLDPPELGFTEHTAHVRSQTTPTTTQQSTPTSLSTSTTTSGSTSTAVTGSTTSGSLSTTTGSLTTTTTPHPITTVKPKDKVYYVNDSSEICILLAVDVKITIKNSYLQNGTYEANVDNVTKVSGVCGTDKENIVLHFFKDWHLNFSFAELHKNEYFIDEVELSYNTDNFPHEVGVHDKNTTSIHNKTDFSNKNGMGYKCDSGIDGLTAYIGWNYTLAAEIRNFRVEAFRINATSIEFTANGEKNCYSNHISSNLVPIIVGSVLIALILIVLIAYLISRRRRRAGYESV